jgi:hypothetical protein
MTSRVFSGRKLPARRIGGSALTLACPAEASCNRQSRNCDDRCTSIETGGDPSGDAGLRDTETQQQFGRKCE